MYDLKDELYWRNGYMRINDIGTEESLFIESRTVGKGLGEQSSIMRSF